MLLALLVVASPFAWQVARWGVQRASVSIVQLRDGAWAEDDASEEAFRSPGRVTGGWSVADVGEARWAGRVEKLPAARPLRDVAALPDGRVVAVGAGGTVLERSLRGSWRVLSAGGPDLEVIAVSLSGTAYAAGAHGALVSLGPPVVPMVGTGPDLVDLRFDERTKRFLARVAEVPTAQTSVGQVALVGAAGLVALLILGLTAVQLRRWLGAMRLSRCLGSPVAEIEREGEVVRYAIRAKVRRAMAPGHVLVRLLGYDVQAASRELIGCVERAHEVSALAAGALLLLEGEAAGVPGELILEVAVTLGGARAQLRARL